MFKDLLTKTRSYRNFDSTVTYTKEDMEYLISLTRLTPSAANKQPLKYAYAYKKEDCDKIFPLLSWAGYLEEKPPYDNNVPTAYILICFDTEISTTTCEMDAGICAQTIVLGAMEKGIGACMLGSMKKDEIKKIFNLPEHIVPRLIVALGKPKETVEIVDAKDGDIKYYRDGKEKHFVPKRTLEEILLPEIK
ncbi:MAG: nitroreductase family protein [Clostridia bacterium]|nr:nitroreductase family protein [Clostridia bacterium]